MTDHDHLKAALADRYAIEREIGAGGMAMVYLARDLKQGRQVAVKVLHDSLPEGEVPIQVPLQLSRGRERDRLDYFHMAEVAKGVAPVIRSLAQAR